MFFHLIVTLIPNNKHVFPVLISLSSGYAANCRIKREDEQEWLEGQIAKDDAALEKALENYNQMLKENMSYLSKEELEELEDVGDLD